MKEKLIINTNLLRKESEFRTKSCVVEKAIAVSNAEFENLKRHPLRDNRLIAENVDLIDYNASPIFTDTARCITARQNSGMSHHKGEHSAVFVDLNEKPQITENARCLHTRMDLEVTNGRVREYLRKERERF